MRVLLDTNIIIHRENDITSNYSIGHLYRWLDKLGYVKIVHPYTIEEIKRYDSNPDRLTTLLVKLESYEKLITVAPKSPEFNEALSDFPQTENDLVDNALLNEIFLGRVDILITEDRGIHKKAKVLDISNRIQTINSFISICTSQHPDLIDYKMLGVRKKHFGEIDLEDSFFDTFRRDYEGFDAWFQKKCDETAYICENNVGELLGFLYVKIEDQDENYLDIAPKFTRKKRLKIGTFKIESTGFRLGERFLKVIFDNAIQNNVEEIYVTMFEEREELIALSLLLQQWGFTRYGIKETNSGVETVLVKKLGLYDLNFTTKMNFPTLQYNHNKFILPILPEYHTTLLPDSILRTENEVDFLGAKPHRYALQKAYISFTFERNIRSGDLILFYRMGDRDNKKYSSVLTTLGVVDEIYFNFPSKEAYLKRCQNRTVFSDEELEDFWRRKSGQIVLLKFIFVKSLTKRITLGDLWEYGIIQAPSGPRPFTQITDKQFNDLLQKAQTNVSIFV